ncbi:glutaredoxin 2 [Salinimonas chungwhensis]|uniref:glutaredoxin 2 n=1 Tax=Salinimonas chungwhensis TaxID=265425 RepID=UPI000373E9DB|nr:glutaredoxin 2 [Salinimonas chungwhensis]
MITLYQYQHCPFCVKADMVANYLNIRHQKVYLLNDDEETAMRLVNHKGIPILEREDGVTTSRSDEIIQQLLSMADQGYLSDERKYDLQITALDTIANDINAMVFPRCIMIKQPEFSTQSARDYFKQEKEKKLSMSFATALENSEIYQASIEKTLSELPPISLPSQDDNTLAWDDLKLYPTLRNLTMIKNIRMNDNQRAYMDEVATLTNTIGYSDRAQ